MANPPPVSKKLYPGRDDNGTGRFARTVLAAAFPYDTTIVKPDGKPARMFRVATAGTLVFECAGDYDSAGAQVQVSITATAGEEFPVALYRLVSGTATDIRVFW